VFFDENSLKYSNEEDKIFFGKFTWRWIYSRFCIGRQIYKKYLLLQNTHYVLYPPLQKDCLLGNWSKKKMQS